MARRRRAGSRGTSAHGEGDNAVRAAACTIRPASVDGLHRRRRFRDRRHDRDVVELLQAAGAPPALGRPPTEHDERRTVEVGRRDRRHPVRDARSGGQDGKPRIAGQLGVRLGGERGRLLVASVDHPHALVAGGVVQRPHVAAVEREHHVDAELAHRGDGLLSCVPGHRRGQRHHPLLELPRGGNRSGA